jgi:hypothetical protein
MASARIVTDASTATPAMRTTVITANDLSVLPNLPVAQPPTQSGRDAGTPGIFLCT